MLKNFKKFLNLVITENIFKYTTEKYKEHIKKFPNIVHLVPTFQSFAIKKKDESYLKHV